MNSRALRYWDTMGMVVVHKDSLHKTRNTPIALRVIGLMLMTVCFAQAAGAASTDPSSRSYTDTYDRVWGAVISALQNEDIGMNAVDKASGLINGTKNLAPSGSDIFTGYVNRLLVNITVLQTDGNRVDVRISCRQERKYKELGWEPSRRDTRSYSESLCSKIDLALLRQPQLDSTNIGPAGEPRTTDSTHLAALNLKQPARNVYTSYGEFDGVSYDSAWLALSALVQKTAKEVEIKLEDKQAGRIECVQMVLGRPGIESSISLASIGNDPSHPKIRVECEMKIVGKGIGVKETDIVIEFARQMDAAKNAAQPIDIQSRSKESAATKDERDDAHADDATARMQQLKRLQDQGLITDEEYQRKRDEILKSL